MADKRRDKRRRVRIRAELSIGGRTLQLQTGNVAERGVFLRTDETVPLRSLVPLKLTLPPDEDEFTVHGMVVHTVGPDDPEDRAPGAAFQFYGMDNAAALRWRRFLKWIDTMHPTSEAPDKPITLAPSGTPDRVKRRHHRKQMEVQVRFKTVDQLFTLYSQDISTGGMLLKTDLDMPIGARLKFQIVHPETGESFAIDCIVRRKVRRPHVCGLGVEFVDMDDKRRADFFGFVINLGDFAGKKKTAPGDG